MCFEKNVHYFDFIKEIKEIYFAQKMNCLYCRCTKITTFKHNHNNIHRRLFSIFICCRNISVSTHVLETKKNRYELLQYT